jgi:DNA modification methylase
MPVHLHCEDCVHGMRRLRDDSVDLVVADPPYNIGVRRVGWDSQSDAEAMRLLRDWTQQAMRALKPGGTLLVWGSPNNAWLARLTLRLVDELGATFVQELAWTYTQGGDGRLTSMRSYATRHERVVWFTKAGAPHYFDPVAIASAYTEAQVQTALRKGTGRLRRASLEQGKPPWSWWTAPRVNSRSHERRHGAHPSMKPLPVARRLILAHSPDDALVVVPFAGSGSELVECAKTPGRTCVAFEVDEAYVQLCLRRLAGVAAEGG